MQIRELTASDLTTRVKWVNDERVNKSMHFDVPITLEGTKQWFARATASADRADYAFEHEGVLCAMGGLTGIGDSAELYIFVAPALHGRGLGTLATSVLCEQAFGQLHLTKIYLYTNGDNTAARRTYERLGFRTDAITERGTRNGDGVVVDRIKYTLQARDFRPCDAPPLMLDDIDIEGRNIKIVRDDVFPAIGGGSKARKALEYERFMKDNRYNAVVTCGGVQSNHNRAIALMATRNHWPCRLVCHGDRERFYIEKGNAAIVRATPADIKFVEPSGIAEAMDEAMATFTSRGLRPYYVHGGGHDLPGGVAYVKAVQALHRESLKANYKPDIIFVASGTGSTQAGILVGLELVGWSDVRVIGISVARSSDRGCSIVAEFTRRLAEHYNIAADLSNKVIFDDRFVSGGYEKTGDEIEDFLRRTMRHSGVIFDSTYSGKALWGMKHYLDSGAATGNAMLWHTGGIMNFLQ